MSRRASRPASLYVLYKTRTGKKPKIARMTGGLKAWRKAHRGSRMLGMAAGKTARRKLARLRKLLLIVPRRRKRRVSRR